MTALQTKPKYREGFQWGLTEGRRGNCFGTQTKSMAYYYGYRDGWQQGILEDGDTKTSRYWASLSEEERSYLRRRAIQAMNAARLEAEDRSEGVE